MNIKRAVSWVAFFSVAAALTWVPEYFQSAEEGDDGLAVVASPAKNTPQGALPGTSDTGKTAAIRDLSPVGDLFSARSWKPAAVLATVTEQPAYITPVVPAPTAPPMPFQFVGRLEDRRDLQVFLQDGEKIYVVRKGDVIDETWRIDSISDVELSFVYLPLHLSQTLSVGSTQ
ncbi:hypothetical protein SAMN04487857_112154 [Pseudomonas sp. ok272]|uniref:hypothetical protein n=1 Tax=unclassified Pseudomonas TaxID=196821 RepID=UPI0008CFEB88|nr:MULTISPECIES: hypothetical protein [unclassified Pseudomonas]SEN26123.1 hypothetical protein SAMN04487857_112154 [Pseudomonas sp. ok272]SFN16962.1 hypothetical protein SAMN04487858_113154 [Pseudomonas sp. ok602]